MITGGDDLLAGQRNLNFSFQFNVDIFSVWLIVLLGCIFT